MSAIWFDRNVADNRVIVRALPAAGRREGVLLRIRTAFLPAAQREAHRHMACLLRQSGGRLTDDIERRLSEQLTRNRNLRF